MKRVSEAMLACVVMVAVACGSGNGEVAPDAGIVGADAAGETPTSTAFVVGADYESGSSIFSTVQVPGGAVTSNALAGVTGSDPVIRSYEGLLYVINRFGADNITVIDPVSMQLVEQISTGPGSNPQDLAVVGDKLYVCAYDVGQIIVLDKAEPAAEPAIIDISSYDADGNPNCASIYRVGDLLYATLQLLDENFLPQAVGKVLVIDPSSNTVTGDFDLQSENPYGFITPGFDGELLVATVDWADLSGCVERIKPGANPSSSCLVTNEQLGGFASAVRVTDDTAWIAVTLAGFAEGRLMTSDAEGTLATASVTPEQQMPTDLAVCPSGEVVVVDAAVGGVRLYSTVGAELTEEPLDIGLPPIASGGVVCL